MEQREQAGRNRASSKKGKQAEERPAIIHNAISDRPATALDAYDTHHANDAFRVGPEGAQGAEAIARGGRAPIVGLCTLGIAWA